MSDQLRKFQQQGDTQALIVYGQSLGQDIQALNAVIDLLGVVFDSLSLGLLPDYDVLDSDKLLQYQNELGFVVGLMMQSPAADMKSAAMHIVSKLDLDSFIPDLNSALKSEHDWIRTEAAAALASMGKVSSKSG